MDFLPEFPHLSLLWEYGAHWPWASHDVLQLLELRNESLSLSLTCLFQWPGHRCQGRVSLCGLLCERTNIPIHQPCSPGNSLCVCLPGDPVARCAGTAFSARGGRVLIAWRIVLILRNSTREAPRNCWKEILYFIFRDLNKGWILCSAEHSSPDSAEQQSMTTVGWWPMDLKSSTFS